MNRIFHIGLVIVLLVCTNLAVLAGEKPTVFTIGDSTVKHGHGDGASGRFGWGQAINEYFDLNKVNFENHAVGGTSSRTYRDKGYWDAVLKELKPGDFVLMQFGHNDSSPVNDNFRARGTIKGVGNQSEEIDNMLTGKHEIVHTYGWYMTQFIEETKAKGATPIIMSPIPRNSWNEEGKLNRNNKNSYGEWAKKVAKKEHILFVDLNAKMCDVLDPLGQDSVTNTYFWEWDHTHTMDKGAALAASKVIEGIKEAPECELNKYILANPKLHFPVKKKIWIIGDSTVADNSGGNITGWGKTFPMYVDTNMVHVFNKARGGRSSRSYRWERLWKEVLDQMTKGDILLMEFGHNDSGKIDEPKYRGSFPGMSDTTLVVDRDGKKETVHSYGWYMTKYVQEAKSKGVDVIVISQIARSRNKDGIFERVDNSYGKWSKEVAKNEKVPFVDLNTAIARLYDAMGEETVSTLFARFPKDRTHTNINGAKLNSYVLATKLRELSNHPIRQFIKIK
ncbi:MAG: rhamnogalacturonan acetylesterase [Mangrovibacterium sp.]